MRLINCTRKFSNILKMSYRSRVGLSSSLLNLVFLFSLYISHFFKKITQCLARLVFTFKSARIYSEKNTKYETFGYVLSFVSFSLPCLMS